MKQSAKFLGLLLAFASISTVTAGEVGQTFYDKKDVRAFFSLKGDYRRMHSQAAEYLNDIMFSGRSSKRYIPDTAGVYDIDDFGYISDVDDYGQFSTDGKYSLQMAGLHFEVGAQYRDFVTWFDINTVPTQVSKAPSGSVYKLRDAKWFVYGADWMFGWAFPNASAPLQLIPSMGGVSLLNVLFPAPGQLWYEGASEEDMKPYTLKNKYYSSLGKTLIAELEARMRLPGGLSIGGYGGYKVARYDELEIEYGGNQMGIFGTPDQNFDQWYVGGKLTYTLPSANMIRENERL